MANKLQGNLKHFVIGYGDFWRGVSIDNPPKGLEGWMLTDWQDGHRTASEGKSVCADMELQAALADATAEEAKTAIEEAAAVVEQSKTKVERAEAEAKRVADDANAKLKTAAEAIAASEKRGDQLHAKLAAEVKKSTALEEDVQRKDARIATLTASETDDEE